ncbi:MAG: helix-turn-helix domain-containing protein [Nitrospinaceae bacterium]
MADDFGAFLKRERELRGVPLEEIAAVTKIHIKYLEALESNNFGELPGEVFIKGFIRSYAKAIGANVEEMLMAYDESAGRERVEQRHQATSSGEDETKRQIRIVNGLVGGFLLIFAIFALWYLTRTPPPEPQQTPAVPAQPGSTFDAPEPGPAESPTTPSLEKLPAKASFAGGRETPPVAQKPMAPPADGAIMETSPDQTVQEDAGEPPPPAAEPGPLVLEIRVTENAWFNLTVDDSRQRDFILPAGSSQTLTAYEGFRITLGNQKGTQLFLNGREVPLPEARGNVLRDFVLTADSLE